jgi:ABC-type uncharacterized transport system involved in gliding motility auxiliary subunit
MSSRSVQTGRNVAVASLLFLGILVVLNVLVSQKFFRIDLTENKEFTISESTKAILGRMDDIVNLKIFFSSDLPSYLATLKSEVGDMLDEFRAYSDGKLLVDFEDPTTDPEIENRVRRLGIPQIQLDVIRATAVRSRMPTGMAKALRGRSETIRSSTDENLEYELAASILKVMQKERKIIGFLTGHGGPTLEEAYQLVREQVEQQYQVRPVDLAGGRAKVPSDITVLVIAGPTGINEREKYLIDQYLMGGGKLLVLEDAIQLVGGALQARPVRSGLETLLPYWRQDRGGSGPRQPMLHRRIQLRIHPLHGPLSLLAPRRS